MRRYDGAAGSIPAWAGETAAQTEPPAGARVYPRVGGGNHRNGVTIVTPTGLSPRGRGKPASFAALAGELGSIPAWAGETGQAILRGVPAKVYPRVGGGNMRPSSVMRSGWGLSPRGRGKRLGIVSANTIGRSIPAWAGETLRLRKGCQARGVYPRVGGGNVTAISNAIANSGLSPRGRGKPERRLDIDLPHRSIPAWAGETEGRTGEQEATKVYPRVGGGNLTRLVVIGLEYGLSPRGRGKPLQGTPEYNAARSIPAWAGETGLQRARLS